MNTAVPPVRAEEVSSGLTMHSVLVWLAAVGFIVLFIFNKADYKVPMLDWALAGATVYTMFLLYLYRASIPRSFVVTCGFALLWVGWGLISFPFLPYIGNHFSTSMLAVVLVLLAVANLYILTSVSTILPRVINLLGIIWVGLSLMMLVLFLQGYVTYENRDFSGLFSNRNNFAIQTAIIAGLVWLYGRRGFWRWAILVASYVLVVNSLSVTGMLSLLAVTFTPLFFRASGMQRLIIVIFVAILMAAAYFGLAELRARLDLFAIAFVNLDALSTRSSAFLRFWLLVNSLEFISAHPLWGIGVDNARYYLVPPETRGLNSHSNVLEMALNGGIPMLVLHYLPMLWAFIVAGRLEREQAINLRSLVVMYVVVGLTSIVYVQFSGAVLYSMAVLLAVRAVSIGEARR